MVPGDDSRDSLGGDGWQQKPLRSMTNRSEVLLGGTAQKVLPARQPDVVK